MSTTKAAETLLAKGLLLPSSATIHGGTQKIFRCKAPECSWKIGANEPHAEMKRIEHARSHRDDDAIHQMDHGHDLTYGEGDPEKANWLKRRMEALVGKVSDPFNPRHY